MTDEIRRLLGGYASGSLTEEEREQLYQAALEDPAVFEAMADEQPLRDLLDDPSHRAELLAAVQERPFSMTSALRDWFERPKSKVIAALGVVALVAIGVKQVSEMREASRPREVAQVLRPVPSTVPNETPRELPATPQQQPAPAPRREAAPVEKRKAAPSAAQSAPAPQAETGEPAARFEAPAPALAAAPPPPPPQPKAEKAAITPVLSYALVHEAGGKARLTINTQQEGTVLAKQGAEVLYGGAISPGVPVVIQRDISAEPIEVEFAASTQGGAMGVVGGVPRAAATALRSSDAGRAAVLRAPQPVRLRIDLRVEKNP